MKIVRDVFALGSNLFQRSSSAIDFVTEAGSSYAEDWREERQLEQAQNKVERAKKWDLLNQAVKASNINVNAKTEVQDFLKQFK